MHPNNVEVDINLEHGDQYTPSMTWHGLENCLHHDYIVQFIGDWLRMVWDMGMTWSTAWDREERGDSCELVLPAWSYICEQMRCTGVLDLP